MRGEAASEAITIGTVTRCALAVFGVAVFFTHLDEYAFVVGWAPKPLYSVFVVVFGAAVLLVLTPRRSAPALGSPIALWAYGFFLVTTLWAIWTRNSTVTAQLVDARYRSIALLVAFAVVFDDPRARRLAVRAVAMAVALGALVDAAEMLGFLDFSRIDTPAVVRVGRAAGFYMNPNSAGSIIVLGLAIAAPELGRSWRVPLVVVTAIGVVATLSRGSMICLGLLLVAFALRRTVGGWGLLLGLALGALIAMKGAGYLESQGRLGPAVVERVTFAKDDSGRGEVALKAWRLFCDAPLLGNGIGAATEWDTGAGAHNMFLTFAAEQGVVGLLLLPALALALIAARRGAAPVALVLLGAGVFSHNLVEDRAILVALALAAAGGIPERASWRRDARRREPGPGGVEVAPGLEVPARRGAGPLVEG